MSAGRKIPILICVDVEPDGRQENDIAGRDWRGFELLLPDLENWRERLAASTKSPVAFNWFWRMDAQVAETMGSATWAADRFAKEITHLRSVGDEMGLHTHFYRRLSESGEWIVDAADRAWIADCLGGSFEAYHRAFGRSCVSHRSGDRVINSDIVTELDRHGVRYDLTPEPGLGPWQLRMRDFEFRGETLDFRNVPHVAYSPCKGNWKLPDPTKHDGLTFLPASTGRCETTAGKLKRSVKQALGMSAPPPLCKTLHFGLEAGLASRMVEQILIEQEKPYLAFLMRTDLALQPAVYVEMGKVLNKLETHPRREEFIFTTPHHAMQTLTNES